MNASPVPRMLAPTTSSISRPPVVATSRIAKSSSWSWFLSQPVVVWTRVTFQLPYGAEPLRYPGAKVMVPELLRQWAAVSSRFLVGLWTTLAVQKCRPAFGGGGGPSGARLLPRVGVFTVRL